MCSWTNGQPVPGIEWITALGAPAIKKLASDGALQLSCPPGSHASDLKKAPHQWENVSLFLDNVVRSNG
jgi:hypothetical protein